MVAVFFLLFFPNRTPQARPRQVVQRRLCGAPFDDVLGSTEQLQRFALRELRVAWFDLRRRASGPWAAIGRDERGLALLGVLGCYSTYKHSKH